MDHLRNIQCVHIECEGTERVLPPSSLLVLTHTSLSRSVLQCHPQIGNVELSKPIVLHIYSTE